jgi:hypothetical protein
MSDDLSHENAQVPAENVLSARPSSAKVPLEHEKEPKMLIAALHQKGRSEADDCPFHPRENGRERWQKSECLKSRRSGVIWRLVFFVCILCHVALCVEGVVSSVDPSEAS